MIDRIVRTKRSKLFIVETILGLLILLGINVIFIPGKPAFEGVTPNPLWIIVLAISARYGRNGALFSSILTSLLFVGYNIAAYSIDVFYEDLWLLRFPFFFILVGFLLGEIKTMFIFREDYLTSRVEELQQLNDQVKKENDIIKEAHKDLTVDVATTQDTITILNEITTKLKSTNLGVIYKGILESFRDYIEAEECSYYSLEGNLLVLKAHEGWKDYQKRPEAYELGKGMVGIAAEKKETLSIKDIVLKRRADVQGMDTLGDSVLVMPVMGPENELYGVASIEKIPLLKLTDSTIQAAKITCELAASSITNAYSIQRMKEQHIEEEGHKLYKYHYFVTRLEEEYLRSLNYMLPLSIMAFKWPKLSDETDPKHATVLESMVELVRSNLRAFDVLARGPIKDVPLILLLATTPGPQANGLKEKIITKIHDYEFENVIAEKSLKDSIVIADFNPNKVSSAKDMLKMIGL